jgi:hypothetical protein
MNAVEIASALGSPHRQGNWWSCRCPAHIDRSPSLSIRDGDRSLIVKCWAGCDARDVLAELRRRGMLAGEAPRNYRRSGSVIAKPPRKVEVGDYAGRRALAQQIWERAGEALGTPVKTYFTKRRIEMPLPPALRWEPYCWHSGAEDWLPAMIAAIVDVGGKLIGVHRTYLRSDGNGKAEVANTKMMLGGAAGGAVQLAPAAGTLMVGESPPQWICRT